MEKYVTTEASKIKRGAKRASYDKATVFQILDDHFICHIPYVYEDTPISIPTIYARFQETLYIHGAMGNRMLNSIASLPQTSITVTHLDGLVLARSAFHHSVNYRSVVVFGKPRVVISEKEKNKALELIVEHMAKGRWEEIRVPNEKEIKITQVLALDISEDSAKIRQGPPVDDQEDYDLELWAGVVPVKTIYKKAVPDPDLKFALDTPSSVKKLTENDK